MAACTKDVRQYHLMIASSTGSGCTPLSSSFSRMCSALRMKRNDGEVGAFPPSLTLSAGAATGGVTLVVSQDTIDEWLTWLSGVAVTGTVACGVLVSVLVMQYLVSRIRLSRQAAASAAAIAELDAALQRLKSARDAAASEAAAGAAMLRESSAATSRLRKLHRSRVLFICQTITKRLQEVEVSRDFAGTVTGACQ